MLITEDCIYDGDNQIKAEFETPFCSFGAPYEIKSLNGLAVSFYGNHPVEASFSLKRGNITEKQENAVTVSLPAVNEDGFRRVKKRLHLKRFFSCKIAFSSLSDFVTVKELHLFAKQHGGGIRIN